MNTIHSIGVEIRRLAALECFACCHGYPEGNWLHSFGCQGCAAHQTEQYVSEALKNLTLENEFQTDNQIEQLKRLIVINWVYILH